MNIISIVRRISSLPGVRRQPLVAASTLAALLKGLERDERRRRRRHRKPPPPKE